MNSYVSLFHLLMASMAFVLSGCESGTVAADNNSSDGHTTAVYDTAAVVDAAAIQSPAVFDGTSLSGWRPVGAAEWTVEDGAIVGTIRDGAGWLVLDSIYGDVGVNLSFECDNCEPGVMIRGQADGDQTSGVFLELAGPTAGSLFRLAFDGQGREVSRQSMPKYALQTITEGPGYLITGGCAPVPCAGIEDAHGGGGGSAGRIVAQGAFDLSADAPNTVLFSAGGEALTGRLNGTRLPNARMDGGLKYGKIALRVAGPSGATVRITNISVRDYTTRVAGLAPEITDPRFRKVQMTDLFYAEGVSVGDINRDGHQDVVAGPFYYLGPNFVEAREIYPAVTINVAGAEYPGGPPTSQMGAITHGSYPPAFMSWVYDFNDDGWPDIFKVMSFGPRPTFSGHLWINPQGERRNWDNHMVIPLITNEANQFVDIDGDGKPELSMQLATRSGWTDAQVGYSSVDWSDPTKPWTFTPVSEKGRWSGHGLATGDVNADGRLDLVTPVGWFEQPAPGTGGLWNRHEARFGRGGADIYVYDVNGDSRPDVVTSLAAHGPGLSWFEQNADGSFEEHLIMGAPAERTSPTDTAFTELHALTLADIDGDGLKDIVTGKRWYSHGYRFDEETDLHDPPVMYWFKLNRSVDGVVKYTPQLINNRSGVGVQIVAADIDGDGTQDVLTSARKGTIVFFNSAR